MAKNPKTVLMIGLVLLLAGALLTFMGGPAGASSAQEEACRQEMASRGPDGAAMADSCSEANFAIAITAKNANDAASAISGNNQSEILGGMLGKFLLGFGLALTAVGAIRLFARK